MASVRRVALLLMAAAALMACWALPASGQTPGKGDPVTQADPPGDPVMDEEAIVAPHTIVEDTQQPAAKVSPAQSAPQAPSSQDPGQPAARSGDGKPGDREAAVKPRIALGNAAFQKPAARRAEARRSCRAPGRPAPSPMLGVSGVIVVDEDRNWALLLLIPAAGLALLAFVLFILRMLAADGRTHDPLERMATLVAITAGLVGLVIQFAPGVAVAERPAREAAMDVREVHPRVTRGEYADKIGAAIRLSKTDAREVGNVIWLELNLRGYEGARPVLQYGLYDEGRGEVLLPNTAKETQLGRQSGDEQTSFVPIWVGYPTTTKFRAQFRLLDRGRVQEMARTGEMRGSAYRYDCARA